MEDLKIKDLAIELSKEVVKKVNPEEVELVEPFLNERFRLLDTSSEGEIKVKNSGFHFFAVDDFLTGVISGIIATSLFELVKILISKKNKNKDLTKIESLNELNISFLSIIESQINQLGFWKKFRLKRKILKVCSDIDSNRAVLKYLITLDIEKKPN